MTWNPKFPKQRRLNRSAQEETLWRWFSRYIRLRDTDNGICRCITCWRTGHPKDFQAGHFIKRNRWSLKYDHRNVHAQCVSCNTWEDGNAGAYAVAIDKKYGAGTAEILVALGTKKGMLKAWECKILAEEYRKKTYIEIERTGLEKWWD